MSILAALIRGEAFDEELSDKLMELAGDGTIPLRREEFNRRPARRRLLLRVRFAGDLFLCTMLVDL